ncbi:COG4422 Bacteriophage protein gp37 [uncultured Caudovirales phage]|uniref:COG4422 Bacteriophage protein gp37 n=1 Tax=uncultured Caudovirales phage TaxID=2100421 RepID=A0A6J5Q9S9_9CAUD|nr:COG4422 Bacteriophage protein gp37 [uncultured Caudovirales phage]
MGEKTGIAWTDHTFNPWIGCTKVSPGCDHCYAESSRPAAAMKIKWGLREPRHRTSKGNWNLPLRWNRAAQEAGQRRLVFCASLADVFDNEVSEQWREDLFALIDATPFLTWLILTKRIGNAAAMIPGKDRHNVWIGASVVNQAEADRDIPKLMYTPAAVRFVSYEPALEPVDFRHWLAPTDGRTGLDWIIVGGESDQGGVKARPFKVEWARSVVAQCNAAGVPVFVKQLGSNPVDWCVNALLDSYPQETEPGYCDIDAGHEGTRCAGRCKFMKDSAGGDPMEWPEGIRVREFPPSEMRCAHCGYWFDSVLGKYGCPNCEGAGLR